MTFKYYPPGDLDAHDAGRGRKDRKVYLPNIIYPLKLADGQHPHMNSQIWGFGGGGWNGKGEAGGSECDPRNYDPMRQRDDYCEVRGWSMPMCPAGVGHQGQDIRPPTCKDKTWEVQAVADGTVLLVSSNTTVRIKGTDGTTYEYLHMHPDTIKVDEGDKVKQGQVLGRVSNIMNGARATTMHLHFQVRRQMTINGKVLDAYVPTFPSLIVALRKAKGIDPGIDADGNLIVDPRREIGAPQPAPTPEPPKPVPAPTPEPPKPVPAPTPEPPKPAPTPEPPKPAPTPEPPKPEPVPAPEPPKPAPTPEPPKPEPVPTPEPPKPAPTPEPPKPEPVPTPEPPKPAPTPEPPKPEPVPAPEPPKPAPTPEPPKPAPVPTPEPPKPAPKAEEPAPTPAPAPAPSPAPEPPKPEAQKQGWWQWAKDKASAAKDAARDKVSGWYNYWWAKK